ncbi:MAG: sialate O-acetylesterase [Planctomycetota bacterium]|nr:sialate O-acetylesterase [Planctomycetota bacterium]
MPCRRLIVVAAALLLACGLAVSAELKLPAILGNNMVLQRGVETPLWGGADANEKITAKLGDKSVTATAGADGKWLVKLPAMPAGGPQDIVIEGAENRTVSLKNVLFGEVWVCSGQSNMEMAVQSCEKAQEDIAAASFPQIRLFTVAKAAVGTPQPDCRGQWQECSPQTVRGFSAAGYFFGVELHKTLGVPIGLINTSWGGTPAESWASRQGLDSEPSCKQMVEHWDRICADFNEEKAKQTYEQQLKAWNEAAARAKADKRPAPPNKPNYSDPRANPWRPCALYNGMIAPLVPFAIAGAIWYQGESNVGRAVQYRTLFPAMIKSWRTAWARDDLPFYFVQIAPYRYGQLNGLAYAELCESQLLTIKNLPNTGMAVISDVGNVKNIHPGNKKAVGRRLALWALAKTYGRKEMVYYKSMKVEGDKIRVSFDYVGGGLASRDGKDLTCFAIAGDDQRFEPAAATIDGDTVVVRANGVLKPVAVRFAWHETAEPNLMNKEGLPASLFRTDEWKMVTEGKNL